MSTVKIDKKEPNTEIIGVAVPASLKKRIILIAEEDNRTVSQFIRMTLERSTAEYEEKKTG